MLKQHLQQKIQQKLSPQQIQLIKLLEIPSVELEERVKKELEENPALEEGKEIEENDLNNEDFSEKNEEEDFSIEDYDSDDDIPDYKLNINNHSADNERNNIPVSFGISFHEHLIDQLGLQQLSSEDRFLAEYIIGNIDDEGYLKRTPEDVCDDILFQTGKLVKPEKIVDMLEIIQEFDPAGVGARNLQECLLLQLKRKAESEFVEIAEKTITECFDEFSKKHYDKILKKLNIDEETLKKAIAEITKLNPKPGNSWGNIWEKNMAEITPDFILENIDGELFLRLNNDNIPDLRVNKMYSAMMQKYANKNESGQAKEAALFVKQKLDSAKWFIDAIKQRQITLLTTMNAIIQLQKEYFLTGDDSLLKPMIMKDIATATGYDISTISRVSNSKYIETDFGIFSVKHFFTEAAQTDSGEEITTREIKNILADYIANENEQHPFTDDELSEMLKKKGFTVARRTVAKYREQLNIPVARLRKELKGTKKEQKKH